MNEAAASAAALKQEGERVEIIAYCDPRPGKDERCEASPVPPSQPRPLISSAAKAACSEEGDAVKHTAHTPTCVELQVNVHDAHLEELPSRS